MKNTFSRLNGQVHAIQRHVAGIREYFAAWLALVALAVSAFAKFTAVHPAVVASHRAISLDHASQEPDNQIARFARLRSRGFQPRSVFHHWSVLLVSCLIIRYPFTYCQGSFAVDFVNRLRIPCSYGNQNPKKRFAPTSRNSARRGAKRAGLCKRQSEEEQRSESDRKAGLGTLAKTQENRRGQPMGNDGE